MLPYRITKINAKSGFLKEVHHSILNRLCQILSLEIGQRGWLLVDVGDTEFGPHRISISRISSICNNHEHNEILIETENSIYLLVKEKYTRYEIRRSYCQIW